MAKASAGGSTHYVAEGAPVPADLPGSVRLVGPGAPAVKVAEPVTATVSGRVKARRVRAGAAGG